MTLYEKSFSILRYNCYILMQNYKPNLCWCICSRYGVWMFLCRSIATNKMFRTYVCPFCHIINSKVLLSTCSYPPFTFFFAFLAHLSTKNKKNVSNIEAYFIMSLSVYTSINDCYASKCFDVDI